MSSILKDLEKMTSSKLASKKMKQKDVDRIAGQTNMTVLNTEAELDAWASSKGQLIQNNPYLYANIVERLCRATGISLRNRLSTDIRLPSTGTPGTYAPTLYHILARSDMYHTNKSQSFSDFRIHMAREYINAISSWQADKKTVLGQSLNAELSEIARYQNLVLIPVKEVNTGARRGSIAITLQGYGHDTEVADLYNDPLCKWRFGGLGPVLMALLGDAIDVEQDPEDDLYKVSVRYGNSEDDLIDMGKYRIYQSDGSYNSTILGLIKEAIPNTIVKHRDYDYLGIYSSYVSNILRNMGCFTKAEAEAKLSVMNPTLFPVAAPILQFIRGDLDQNYSHRNVDKIRKYFLQNISKTTNLIRQDYLNRTGRDLIGGYFPRRFLPEGITNKDIPSFVSKFKSQRFEGIEAEVLVKLAVNGEVDQLVHAVQKYFGTFLENGIEVKAAKLTPKAASTESKAKKLAEYVRGMTGTTISTTPPITWTNVDTTTYTVSF